MAAAGAGPVARIELGVHRGKPVRAAMAEIEVAHGRAFALGWLPKAMNPGRAVAWLAAHGGEDWAEHSSADDEAAAAQAVTTVAALIARLQLPRVSPAASRSRAAAQPPGCPPAYAAAARAICLQPRWLSETKRMRDAARLIAIFAANEGLERLLTGPGET